MNIKFERVSDLAEFNRACLFTARLLSPLVPLKLMQQPSHPPEREISLDPENWDDFRSLAHAALDDAIDFVRTVRERPVWNAVPEAARQQFRQTIPVVGHGFLDTYRDFKNWILPYPTGNIHPRFFGWVHGTGTPSGIVADLLASAMNSNCGGRDHGALYVERCVIDWCKQLFSYPATAGGLLVSGTSIANLIALTVARNSSQEYSVRRDGFRPTAKLAAYASSEAHESVAKALEIIGLGSGCLRAVPVKSGMNIDLSALRLMIDEDRRRGHQPWCVVGSAGTVNTGSIDDLAALAAISAEEGMWFHVDGAFGALCVLNDDLRSLVKGIELADSIAFDFHKWMHVQYDAGCVLVKSAELHRQAFSMRPAYLAGADRGLAGGDPWFCDFGPELSRSFRALKVWFALKEHGTARLGRIIKQNCEQARYLAQRVKREPQLELLLEPALNVVCFRFIDVPGNEVSLDQLNLEIVADLHESGIAAPSTTRVNGKLAIRVAITNHRSRREDFDILVDAILEVGKRRTAGSPHFDVKSG